MVQRTQIVCRVDVNSHLTTQFSFYNFSKANSYKNQLQKDKRGRHGGPPNHLHTGSTTLNCQPSGTTDCVILCYMSALAGQMDKTFVHKDSHDSLLHRLTLNACGQPWSGHCLPEWQQMECHQHQHNQPFRHSCRQFRWNSCRVQKEE